jgi:hypothetical protein
LAEAEEEAGPVVLEALRNIRSSDDGRENGDDYTVICEH